MTNVKAYMAQIELAIAGAFHNDKLAVHLLGAVQGPHTLTFGVKLYQPTRANVAKALALAGAIEAATSVSPVRIYSEQGAIMVEVPSPVAVVVYGRKLSGQGFAVPLGYSARRAVVGVDFDANPHLILVGPTQRGKTTAARNIAYHLAKQNRTRQARFIVSTFRGWEWGGFEQIAHTMAVVTDAEESAQMIRWLRDVMMSRTKDHVLLPKIFVFLDDLFNLLATVDVADELGQIASLGRGCGIHLVLGTQRLNEKGAGSGAVTGNITERLIFGTASAQDAAQYAGRGESGAEKLGRYKGDALLLSNGAVTRLAVALVDDEDLASLERGADVWRPWHGKAGTAAPRANGETAGRASGITQENGGNTARHVPPNEGGENAQNGDGEGSPARHVPTVTRLPNAPPTADEQQYLRDLFGYLGTRRKVLLAAWGGVVNDSGKTPKTEKWLADALGG